MKICIILFGVLALHLTANATPQDPDTLIHEGATFRVYGFKFAEDLEREIYKHKSTDERWIFNSGLWRGYRAILQIRDEKLFLMGIYFDCEAPRPTPKDILGFSIPDSGVHMTHFSGSLFYGHGASWGYMQNSESGEQEKRLRKYEFADGQLTKVSEIKTNRPIQLIEEQLISDIQMLKDFLHGTSDDPNDPFKAQDGADQPATVPKSKPQDIEKLKPESKVRPQ